MKQKTHRWDRNRATVRTDVRKLTIAEGIFCYALVQVVKEEEEIVMSNLDICNIDIDLYKKYSATLDKLRWTHD